MLLGSQVCSKYFYHELKNKFKYILISLFVSSQPFTVHAYSAYLELRHPGRPPFVRVLAIAEPATKERNLEDSRYNTFFSVVGRLPQPMHHLQNNFLMLL